MTVTLPVKSVSFRQTAAEEGRNIGGQVLGFSGIKGQGDGLRGGGLRVLLGRGQQYMQDSQDGLLFVVRWVLRSVPVQIIILTGVAGSALVTVRKRVALNSPAGAAA